MSSSWWSCNRKGTNSIKMDLRWIIPEGTNLIKLASDRNYSDFCSNSNEHSVPIKTDALFGRWVIMKVITYRSSEYL